MGIRFVLLRVFATLLLLASPAAVSAAPAESAPSAASKAPVAAKAKVAKAKAKAPAKKRVAKARYSAPVSAVIVVDAATGQVLSESNADTKGYPASLTKMMTLYMLFEAIERGEVGFDTAMPVSARAAAAAPSKLGLRRKGKITVEQAIGALITKSANDVAIVTAEKLGGTEDKFAQMMTTRAQQLGMEKTTFKNASGLPNPQQFSTARDMAILAHHLIKDYPQHYAHFSRMEYVYQGQTIRTHNRLLEFYEGADGIKTGFTSASGFNLVGSATRNGYRVIGVIFGGATATARDRRLAQMMDQGFRALSGEPNAMVAGGNTIPFVDRADRIGTQIALAQSGGVTEEGDSDAPFASVTRTSGGIETTSLPPVKQKNTRVASLTQPSRPAPATRSMDDFADSAGVQIGAYSTRDRAATQADAAASRLKSTFANATAVVMGVKVKGRFLYRARIMGLDEADLLQACGLIPTNMKSGTCQAIRPGA